MAVLRHYLTHASGDVITLERAADALGVPARRLSRAVRHTAGMSFGEFVRTERMRVARRLLLQTSRPIRDIGRQLGFSTASNFSTAFKRDVGMTPSAYRAADPLYDLMAPEPRMQGRAADRPCPAQDPSEMEADNCS